jgi:putative addiction module component (TIGR02574 family)
MVLERFPEFKQLTAVEKLLFVTEAWNDLEEHPAEVPVSREIVDEMQNRLEHFRQHPDQFTTWEAIRQRVQGSKQ